MRSRSLVAALLALTLALCVVSPAAAAPATPDPWARLRFLLGEWSGEGAGSPGAGGGGSTFTLDLEGNILVRRNRADYPATSERAAFSHSDLLVIYPERDSTFRAIYRDNEGHIIRYRLAFGDSAGRVAFDSEGPEAAPRFRLTYELKPDGALEVGFETAPPGGTLKRYVTGTLRRVPAKRPR